MFFLVNDFGTLSDEKAVDTVVAGFFGTVGMDATACYDDNVGTVLNDEVIVYNIMDTAVCDAGRNVYGFLFILAADVDINTGLVFFGCDLNVLGRLGSFKFSFIIRYFC